MIILASSASFFAKFVLFLFSVVMEPPHDRPVGGEFMLLYLMMRKVREGHSDLDCSAAWSWCRELAEEGGEVSK